MKNKIIIFLIIILNFFLYVQCNSKNANKINEEYCFHLIGDTNLYEEANKNSKIILVIHTPNYFQIIEKINDPIINEYNQEFFWYKIKMENNIIGWIMLHYCLHPMDKKEYNETKIKFENLKKVINKIEVPSEKGNVEINLIKNSRWGPLNNRYGLYYVFNDDNTFALWDTSIGAVPEVGIWEIKNGYLIIEDFGIHDYEFLKKKIYFNYDIDDNSPYLTKYLKSSNDDKIYNTQSMRRVGQEIALDNFKAVIIYKDIVLSNKKNIYSKPDLNSSIVKLLDKDRKIKIIAYAIINGKVWYYIDSMTDSWMAPDSYEFGWITIEGINIKD